MNLDNKSLLEDLLVYLTGMDEDAIHTTMEPIWNGTWAMPQTAYEEEKEFAQSLLEWALQMDGDVCKEAFEPILDGGWEVVWNDVDPGMIWKPVLPDFPHFPENGTDPGFSFPPFPDPEDVDNRMLTRAFVLLCSYIFYDQFHYPQPQIGEYNITGNPFEKLKWLYRYWFNQLEVAEKDSGLEEYFRQQNLYLSEDDFEITNKVTLSSAGDLLAVDVLTPENTPYLFDAIKDFYSDADLVCANLESTVDKYSPVGRTQVKGQPAKMNTSEEMFWKFRNEAGINYFSTANNHAMDWGEQGVLATLNVLKQSGAYYSGTNENQQQQDDVLIVDKNGIKIAMLSYTFDINGNQLPPNKSYLVNEVRFNDQFCNIDMVKRHVAKAKEKGADIILAFCHWGWEFEMYPHNNIVEVAREMLQSGVDAILGNHPHVSQPMERYDSRPDSYPPRPEALVVYAYGDFVSFHPDSRNSKIAYLTKFDIVKGKSKVTGETETRLVDLKMLPIYILNEKLSDTKYDCRILKFKDVYENPDDYGLTDLEKWQLPHLNDVVLRKILLPEDYSGILVE
ncbi:CapA family protein [Clostridium minihomine]|uniref:CapA family protein n=1 Tax=Clostridium minihomine TaxID=2045012 RepID=UPI001A9362EC|nr:CapA family protein [Clostridium minihomine]